MKTLLFGMVVGVLSAMGATVPQVASAQSLVCTMNPPNPIGTGTPTSPCDAFSIAAFNYDAHFTITGLGSGPYTYSWSAVTTKGDPQAPLNGGAPCTSTCDQSFVPTSNGNTVVQVTVTITNTVTHGVLGPFTTSAKAPCVTVKPVNHPTLC